MTQEFSESHNSENFLPTDKWEIFKCRAFNPVVLNRAATKNIKNMKHFYEFQYLPIFFFKLLKICTQNFF